MLTLTSLAAIALGARTAAAQTSRITGTVLDQQSGAGLSGAQVAVQGTTLGALSQDNGKYTISAIPNGTYTVVVRRVGYAPITKTGVVLDGGETKLDFSMSASALRLNETVVTGVTDPTAAEKVPFSVAKINQEEMPVPGITTSAILQGKVAGATVIRGSGQPGEGSSVMLRTPTAIQKGNSPMYVVDGVILSSVGNTTVDLDALDIESIEIVKGAAAASLYGSKAANGVIQIKTASGRQLAQGRTRVTYRSEFGNSQLAKELSLNTHHWFKQDASGAFLDSKGVATTASNLRVADADRISDNAFPTPLYNNLRSFFNPGASRTNALSIAQNSGRSNWLASFNRATDAGVVKTLNGYTRDDFRVNLDNSVRDNMTLGVRAYHMRSYSDEQSGSPFQDLIYMMPDVNAGAVDSLGNFIPHPDPLAGIDNPIWRQNSRDNWTKRDRTLASADLAWSATDWLRFSGMYGYDRSGSHYHSYVPKGVELSDGSPSTGSVEETHESYDKLNTQIMGTATRQFGELNTRLSVSGLIERQMREQADATGSYLFVKDVPSLSIARDKSLSSTAQEIRTSGLATNLGLDYAGKYTADLSFRRDGSSLFGPAEKWHSYQRVAGAYRMAEESWWPWKNTISEFKLHYAVGSAGGQPSFADQFETFSVSSTGSVSKSTLGNPYLKPMLTVEREAGLDITLWNRISAELVHARSQTSDQIISVPAPATSGYSSQWVNAGTIRGNSTELTLRADLVRDQNVNWSMMVTGDKTSNRIVAWGRNCIFDGDGLGYYCPGISRGDMFGYQFVTNASQLPGVHANSASQFQLNDDGYLVPIGTSGTWKDVSNFGKTVSIDGVSYNWGLPITVKTQSGADSIMKIGTSTPRLRLGWGNNVRWKALAFYGLFDWQVGNNVYNATKQRLYQYSRSGDVDQFGKADETKKPIDYYLRLYSSNNNVSAFVEPASFLKLRELSVRYTPSNSVLSRTKLDKLGAERMSVALIGRNLMTWTRYTGYDPEVGNAINRYDVTTNYPLYRTITGSFEIVF